MKLGSTFATSSTGKPSRTLRRAAPELLDLLDHDDTKTPHTYWTNQSKATYTLSAVLCCRFLASLYRISFRAHGDLSRFWRAKSLVTIILAMYRPSLRFSEGRPPCGRIIQASRIDGGSSSNGVGPRSTLSLDGLLVKRLSYFHEMILWGVHNKRSRNSYILI